MSIRQGGKIIAGNVSHYNTGDTFMTKRTDTSLAGAVECDGATYNTTDFTGSGSIGELLEAGKLDYVSLSAYSTAISTKGWCDKIGWDGTGTTSFRVPTLNAHIVQTNNIPVIGNGMTLGLVNKDTNYGAVAVAAQRLAGLTSQYGEPQGVPITTGSFMPGDNSGVGITTDPTKSGIIADTTDTAQLRVMIQIANGATDEALETCTGVLADVATLKGYDYVVESQLPTAQNNYTWYRKYKSGWVEQGGRSGGKDVTITMPVEMSDNHYVVLTDIVGRVGYASLNWEISSITTTGFRCFYDGDSSDPTEFSWQVSGMAAQ